MSAFDAIGASRTDVAAPTALLERLRAALHDRDAEVTADSATEGEVVAALATLVPDALAMHGALGIPPDVTAATLVDVGEKHRVYGARHELPWLLGILRGDVLSVGRLQVERRPGATGAHGLHLPRTGPLWPHAVDTSLARAHQLLGATRFTCTSWLLEPVLAEALPDTNIAAFARRFALDPATTAPTEAGARSAAKFVFTSSLDVVRDPARVSPKTRLERLVAQRLRSDAGWAEPTGVLDRSGAPS
ncbi:acyltransferase domain-containing protein [uncultured Microbacterium sp.]|uniref:acyltransferase domain-containing protein n=1 Tax=uncultured Microbacterium sp. TaxID=191216 RepID=UPI0025EAD60F|nr:acyltransferase domain-containing protein [uncultured Microbacterium sp.]